MNLFTCVHVLLSLVGIFSGFVVVAGMISDKPRGCWTSVFLASTLGTSVTGFLFPFHRFMPSHGVGIVSLVVLAVAIYARYGASLSGSWRRTYVVTAVIALYLNVFVLIVQGFEKVPPLRAVAPKQSEPPFVATQAVAMLLFVALGIAAARNFKSPPHAPEA